MGHDTGRWGSCAGCRCSAPFRPDVNWVLCEECYQMTLETNAEAEAEYLEEERLRIEREDAEAEAERLRIERDET